MLNTDLLKTPVEFRGRCFLDSYRGTISPDKIERDSFRYASKGWGAAARKVVSDAYGPIPDRWYGTNCDLQLWETGRKLRLKAQPFAFWLYLLSLDQDVFPWVVSNRDKRQMFGGACYHISQRLEDCRLISASKTSGGSSQQIYRVFREPASYELVSYWRKKLAPRVLSPDGKIHIVFEVPQKFARKHGLTPDYFRKLLNGELEQYRGWQLSDRRR
ncbi:MAG: hypothetical protein ACO3NK_12485 [Prochlorotrichaceae cyanobacterium]